MAMINCPECGKEISDKAKSCPHCGYPIDDIQQEHATRSSVGASPEDATISSDSKRCRICGKVLIDESRIYCDECREKIKHSAYATKANSQMKKYETQTDNTNIFMPIFKWLAAAIIILLAIGVFASHGINGIFAFVCFIASGFFISPLSKKTTASFPRWLKIATPVIFFFAAVITTPSTETENVASVNESVIESTEQTETVPEEQSIISETEFENTIPEELVETETAIETAIETESSPAFTKEEFAASCQQISYKNLLRNPNDYIGQRIMITAKIQQVMQGGWLDDNQYYRVQTDNDGYEWYYDDEYFMYDYRVDDDTKLLQDDVLIIYAEFAGLETVTRALTSTKEEIPAIKAYFVEIIAE